MKELLEKIIGKRSLSMVEKTSGVSKATCSRLLNGNYRSRPSASVLWKLTTLDIESQSDISFEDVMFAAGYTAAEVQRYRYEFSIAGIGTTLSEREKRIKETIRGRMVDLLFEFTMEEVFDNEWRCIKINVPEGRIKEWLFVFPPGWEYGNADFVKTIGFCTLLPVSMDRKLTVVLEDPHVKEYAFKTSFSGNLSVMRISENDDFIEEIYLAANGDEQILL